MLYLVLKIDIVYLFSRGWSYFCVSSPCYLQKFSHSQLQIWICFFLYTSNWFVAMWLWPSNPFLKIWHHFLYFMCVCIFFRYSANEIDYIFMAIYFKNLPPNNKVVGGYYIGFTPSVRLSVCPSVRPACRVRSVTSTVLDGLFPY